MTAPEPPETEPTPPEDPPTWPPRIPTGWTLPPLEGLGGLGGSGSADGSPPEHRCLELCPICRTADVLRVAGPPELRGQLDDVGREALLTLRALIDHYLERMDQRPDPSASVRDIPID